MNVFVATSDRLAQFLPADTLLCVVEAGQCVRCMDDDGAWIQDLRVDPPSEPFLRQYSEMLRGKA
jgi:hypothetical protein